MRIDVILTPAELPALAGREMRATVCVVFDILRATSTIVTALHHGAKAIIPVCEIGEALALRNSEFGIRNSEFILLGGERDGLKIRAGQTGGIDFDFGNSPREYAPEKVRGKIIVSTTTNGTRALRAGAGAQTVLAASFLNLGATAEFIKKIKPAEVLLVCAGTGEDRADEDVLAAGALCEKLNDPLTPSLSPLRRGEGVRRTGEGFPQMTESAEIARHFYAVSDLAATVRISTNGRRLLAIPELREDVAFCLQRDVFPLVAKMELDGMVRVYRS